MHHPYMLQWMQGFCACLLASLQLVVHSCPALQDLGLQTQISESMHNKFLITHTTMPPLSVQHALMQFSVVQYALYYKMG